MTIKPHRYRIGSIIIMLAIAMTAIAVFFPGKLWLERSLVAILKAEGFQNPRVTLSAIGLRHLLLKNITFGKTPPLTIRKVVLDYSLPKLLIGQLSELTISGISIEAQQSNGSWEIAGFNSNKNKATTNQSPTLQDALNQIDNFPLNKATIENSNLVVTTDSWRLNVPVHLVWKKKPLPTFDYRTESLRFNAGKIGITTGNATAILGLKDNEKRWTGSWSFNDIAIEGSDIPMPSLNGQGTLDVLTDQIIVQGKFESADKNYKMAFNLDYLIQAPKKSKFTINDALLPWNEGTISFHTVDIPFSGSHRLITVNLELRHIDIGTLMEQLTGKRVSATGTISGTLPTTIGWNGSIAFHEGKLQADEAGIISMSPDAIPGDNQQVALVHDVLANFHYKLFSVQLNSEKDNRLSVRMKLEGNNPDVQSGKPVKLNVHLTGDMLNFIQQNALSLIDPKKFLEQNGNAKR